MTIKLPSKRCVHPQSHLTEIDAYSAVTTRRFRCTKCGFVLYSRRGSRLKHYACEFTKNMVVGVDENGKDIVKRKSACNNPASHFVGLRQHPRCTDHHNPRQTKEQIAYMKETKLAKEAFSKDMKDFDQRCKDIREEVGTSPLPQKEKPVAEETSGNFRYGGVNYF